MSFTQEPNVSRVMVVSVLGNYIGTSPERNHDRR